MATLVHFLTCLIGFLALSPFYEVSPANVLNPCDGKTCRECIRIPACSWCYDEKFDKSSRCFVSNSVNLGQRCPEDFTINHQNSMAFYSNQRLSHAQGHGQAGGGTVHSEYEEYLENITREGIYLTQERNSGFRWSKRNKTITQIAPQHLQLKLRVGSSYSFDMFYTQAEDYPVDLYYLMDLSRSMYDDKETLSRLGDKLALTMRNITSNFQLGFGSFVDKVVMPYVSTLEEKLRQPCSQCEPPYGYVNHMRLNTNTSKFSEMVRRASVSGNLDAPEGGFDAIMQAVVCRGRIGWREEARRLLVYSTDSGFHYAGDGKLGGIVKPNDGECHLDEYGEYSMSTKQDYPSISQVNLKVKENSINIIFAVTENVIRTYKELAKHVEASSYAQLSQNSSNIVEIIKEQYEAISSTIEMKHNASEYLRIKFHSYCSDSSSAMKETAKCSGIKVGDIIRYKVEVELVKCPADEREWSEMVQLYPVGLDESLLLDVIMQCGCECESPTHESYKPKANQCKNSGTLVCGKCVCDPGASGLNCQCTNSSTREEEEALLRRCTNPMLLLTEECSGNGRCDCGKCICEENFEGEFCECDRRACDRHQNVICSGNGNCSCDGCKCFEGWTGTDCSCTKNTTTCINPLDKSAEICSGRGKCECGKCICDDVQGNPGKYCEKCSSCGNNCTIYNDCVQCKVYGKGIYDNVTCTKKCTIEPDKVPQVLANEEKNQQLCAYYDKDGCRYAFVYYFDDKNELVIKAQEELECPLKVFLLGIVLGVIAIVVLVGLAILLMWKLLTTIHDRREFARFEKERMMAKWDTGENPIYKQATSTFKNPTYAGKG